MLVKKGGIIELVALGQSVYEGDDFGQISLYWGGDLRLVGFAKQFLDSRSPSDQVFWSHDLVYIVQKFVKIQKENVQLRQRFSIPEASKRIEKF